MKTVGEALDAGFTVLHVFFDKNPRNDASFAVSDLNQYSDSRSLSLEEISILAVTVHFVSANPTGAVVVKPGRDQSETAMRYTVWGEDQRRAH